MPGVISKNGWFALDLVPRSGGHGNVTPFLNLQSACSNMTTFPFS
jgi:hypothetical protein